MKLLIISIMILPFYAFSKPNSLSHYAQCELLHGLMQEGSEIILIPSSKHGGNKNIYVCSSECKAGSIMAWQGNLDRPWQYSPTGVLDTGLQYSSSKIEHLDCTDSTYETTDSNVTTFNNRECIRKDILNYILDDQLDIWHHDKNALVKLRNDKTKFKEKCKSILHLKDNPSISTTVNIFNSIISKLNFTSNETHKIEVNDNDKMGNHTNLNSNKSLKNKALSN